MRTTGWLIPTIAVLVASCATMQNTPAQEATYEKLRKCPNGGMATVSADGRWQARGDISVLSELVKCMNAQDPNQKARQY